MTAVSESAAARVCVIGAGLAGLAAALDLGRGGRRVTVLEAAREVGGLASSILVDGRPLERFYHFVCRPDRSLIELLDELGISGRLHWRATRTSVFYRGRSLPFSTPLDLLRFDPLPLGERFRMGWTTWRARRNRDWRELDGISAADWLRRSAGEECYETIWRPLLEIKFGRHHEEISAAWIWHRIHRVARSRRNPFTGEVLGYLENGSATVVDALLERLDRMPNVEIRTGCRVEKILIGESGVEGLRLAETGETVAARAVVSTLPLPLLARLAPDLPGDYRQRLESIDYFGVTCALFKLKHAVTDSFWLNVNDPEIAFNGLVCYTNLNRHRARLGGSIVYVPFYVESDSARFGMPASEVFAEYTRAFGRICPGFDESWVEEFHLFKERHAQAICTRGFAARQPGHRAPARGLYVTDSVQFYPEDRTISAAIRVGRTVAGMIGEDFDAPESER